jgi:hypothetical protein
MARQLSLQRGRPPMSATEKPNEGALDQISALRAGARNLVPVPNKVFSATDKQNTKPERRPDLQEHRFARDYFPAHQCSS